jgi:predicted AAA+ superfamily ATPase
MPKRSEVMKIYKPRLIDRSISERLEAFGGILITGPKWCGKSWTATYHASSLVEIDKGDNRERALLAPGAILEGDIPRLIDEWQDAPSLWDYARRLIDDRHAPGQFIFTGSAVPPEDEMSHSGTGRFARLSMLPLSLFESGDSTGAISLSGLFRGEPMEPVLSEMDFRGALHLICKGGWPAAFWLKDEASFRISREYINTIINIDINRADGVKKNPANVRKFLRSLARNVSTPVKFTTLVADVASDDTGLSDKTIRSYYDALLKIYVVVEQEAWKPSLRSKSRIRTSPKRHFSDPSLAAAAFGATPKILEDDIETAGFLFESMCFRDLSVYCETIGGAVYHYQDESGLEADMVIQLDNGDWAALEAKLGTFEFDDAAGNLLKLRRAVDDKTRPPAFLAIVTASGGVAYRRDDGVFVIPIDCLGP